MLAIVDASLCVGCGLCSQLCPDVFEMEGEHAGVKLCPVPEVYHEACRDAVVVCLVEAIRVAD